MGFSWNRRRFLTAAAVLGAGGLGLALRPSDRGASHARYYVELSKALDKAGLARPTLVIDRQRLFANADVLRGHLEGTFLQFGDIAVYDNGEIVERWPVFTQGA